MSKYSKIAEAFIEKRALEVAPNAKGFLGALATGAALTLGGMGVAYGANALGNIRSGARSEKAYETMLMVHPKLSMENPTKVRMYFNTLWNFAPDIARDPLMAGGVIVQAIRMDYTGAPPTELVKTIVDIQNKHRETTNKFNLPSRGPMADYLLMSGQGRMMSSDSNPFAEPKN
jgi:hypothetical protein